MVSSIENLTKINDTLPNLTPQTILDALSDSAAVLDGDGFILMVNECWSNFAKENGGDSNFIGWNYLDVCKQDPGLLNGIRSVINNKNLIYSQIYPSHNLGDEHWYDVTIKPLSKNESLKKEVLVIHRRLPQITDTKQLALLDSVYFDLESIFQTQLNTLEEIILHMLDVFVNRLKIGNICAIHLIESEKNNLVKTWRKKSWEIEVEGPFLRKSSALIDFFKSKSRVNLRHGSPEQLITNTLKFGTPVHRSLNLIFENFIISLHRTKAEDFADHEMKVIKQVGIFYSAIATYLKNDPLAHMPDGICIFNEQLCVLEINDFAKSVLKNMGIYKDGLGKPILQKDALTDLVFQMNDEGFKDFNKAPGFPFNNIRVLFYWKSKGQCVLICRDQTSIMQRHHIESKRNLLGSVRKVTSQIASGMNNQMAIVAGTVERLRTANEHSNADVDVEHDLAQLMDLALNCKHCLNQLLDYCRFDILRNKIFNLNSLCDVINHKYALNRIKISWELPSEGAEICCDSSDKILTAVCNAIDNSIQANSTKITVSINPLIPENDLNNLNINMQDFHILEIRDDGDGVHSSYFDQLTDPFFTTKNTNKHQGLGLAQSDGILRSLGGSVRVSSVFNSGLSVLFVFPKHVKQSTSKYLPLIQPRILYHTQNEMIGLTLEIYAKRLNYDYYSLNNYRLFHGELKKIALGQIHYDLILADNSHNLWSFDDLDGADIVTEIYQTLQESSHKAIWVSIGAPHVPEWVDQNFFSANIEIPLKFEEFLSLKHRFLT
ncbi:MAG: hypothetical protein ACI8V2_000799 [Candidatus Latescibacterota bacterium]|jgi:hypothetical protein